LARVFEFDTVEGTESVIKEIVFSGIPRMSNTQIRCSNGDKGLPSLKDLKVTGMSLLNCDISNLMLLTKGENAVLTRLGLRSEDPDLTEAGLNLVRLKQAAKDARKRKKNGN
jgi:hypothetical protein